MESNAIDLGNANDWFVEVSQLNGSIVSLPGHLITSIERQPGTASCSRIMLSSGQVLMSSTAVNTLKSRYARYCQFAMHLKPKP